MEPKTELIPVTEKDLDYYQFPNLTGYPDIWHGIFTRKGGYSKEQFAGLNVSFDVGDKNRAVLRNRQKISRAIGDANLVFAKQVHTKGIIVLKKKNASDKSPPLTCEQGDALVSNVPNHFLSIKVADCQAVLMFDPQKKVVANVHSGWKGSTMNILGSTVAAMKERFGCRSSDIQVGIGPSLGPCCAEFKNYRSEIPKNLWQYEIKPNYFDFWAMSRDQLTKTGIPEKNIVSSNICTRCHPELFFSYRRQKLTGRFAAIIGIKPDA